MLSFSFHEFIRSGGMAAREREAAARAIAEERESWLAILEGYAATLPDDVPRDELLMRVILDGEIRRLRKLLRLPPPGPDAETLAKRREQTRERVRRHRLRRREQAGAGLPGVEG
jgi:hypothetical protein